MKVIPVNNNSKVNRIFVVDENAIKSDLRLTLLMLARYNYNRSLFVSHNVKEDEPLNTTGCRVNARNNEKENRLEYAIASNYGNFFCKGVEEATDTIYSILFIYDDEDKIKDQYF